MDQDHSHCSTCVRPGRCKSKLQPSCPIVECPYKPGCKASFHACKAAEHAEFTCSEAFVPCLNREYGCDKVLARRKISCHLPHCPASVVHCSFKWVRKLVSPTASNSALDSEDSGLDSPSTPSPLLSPSEYAAAILKVAADGGNVIDWRPVSPPTLNVRCKLCKPRPVVVRKLQVPCPAHYSGRAWASSPPNTSNVRKNDPSVYDLSNSNLPARPEEMNDNNLKLGPNLEMPQQERDAKYLDLALLHRDELWFARTLKTSSTNNKLDFNNIEPTSMYGDSQASNGVKESLLNNDAELDLPLNEYGLQSLTLDNMSGDSNSPSSSKDSSVTSSSEDNSGRPSSALSSYFDYLLAGGSNTNLRNEKLGRRPLSFPPPTTNKRIFGVGARAFSSSSCMLMPDSVLDRILYNQRPPPLLNPLNPTRLPTSSNPSTSGPTSCYDVNATTTASLYEPRIHSYARYMLKPESVHYFTCSQFVRRDGFADHHRNCHTEIQGNVDEWILHHCPLRERGCSFRVQRLVPVSSPHLSRDLVTPKIYRKAPDVRQGDVLYNRATDGLQFKPHQTEISQCQLPTPHISSLPFETLCAIALCLDPFSLYNLSLVSHQFMTVARKLLTVKGIVLTVWAKVSSTLVPTLRPNLFTIDSEGIRRDQMAHAGPGRATLIRKTRWEVVEKKWIYPKSFSTVDDWQIHGNSSAAITEHLKTCTYNERNEQTKPFAYIFPVPDLPDDTSFPCKSGLFKIEGSITIGRVCP